MEVRIAAVALAVAAFGRPPLAPSGALAQSLSGDSERATPADSTVEGGWVGAVDGEGWVHGDDTRGPWPLPSPHPEAGSVRVWHGGVELVSGRGFFVDEVTATLSLAERLSVDDSVRVSMWALPFALPERVSGPGPADYPLPSPDSLPPVPGESVTPNLPPTLFVTGAKTVGVEVGDGNSTGIEQSLRLTVFGQIADEIEVQGVLSDQSIPFQPEGTTTRLDELDRVRLEVRGPHFRSVLGDQIVSHSAGNLARFERKVSGARAELSTRRGTGLAAAWAEESTGFGGQLEGTVSTSAGEAQALRFRGEEGNQGPYRLLPVGGPPAGVVAGSETVWIDGAVLTRGEDRDYVIDYERGELRFTARRMITSEQEIVVDFERAEDEYRRDLWMGRARFSSSEDDPGILGEILIFSEGDDRAELLLGSLSGEDRAALRAAGADPDAARRDGATAVEAGEGDYRLEWVGDDQEAFVYAPGAGDWEVRWSFVGEGGGAYARELPFDGPTFYVYVGEGQGGYAPVVLLPLPERLEVVDLRLASSWGGEVALAGEAAVSRWNPNLWSPGVARTGAALRAGMSWDPGERFGFGDELGVDVELRHTAADYRAPGRVTSTETLEGWDLNASERAVPGTWWEGGAHHRRVGCWRLEGLAARFDPADAVALDRGELCLDLGGEGPWGLLRGNVVRRAGGSPESFREYEAGGGWRGGRVDSQIRWERESRRDSLGTERRFDDLELRSEMGAGGVGSAGASHRWRWERGPDGPVRSSTSTATALWDRGAGASLQGEVAHRVWQAQGSRRVTDLVRLEPSYASPSRWFSAGGAYELGGGQEELAVVRYVAAAGDSLPAEYSFDPEMGTYYRDPVGAEFARILERTGDAAPVLTLRAHADVTVKPGLRWNEGLMPLWSMEASLRLEERSRTAERRRLALLDPGVQRTPGETLDGRWSSRVDVFLRPDALTWNTRLRWTRSRILSDPSGTSPRIRSVDAVALRLRGQLLPGWVGETEGGLESEIDRWGEHGVDSRVDGGFARAEITHRRRVETFVRAEVRHDRVDDRGQLASLASFSITPGARWEWAGRGRLETELGAELLRERDGRVAVSLRRGREIGVTWRGLVRSRAQVTELISCSGDVGITVEPDSGLDRRVNIQLSAAF